MKITLEMLEAKSACREGRDWFVTQYPDGGNCQAVIDKAVEDGHPDYADWLLNAFGATDDVLELKEFKGEHLYFAGTIKVSKSLVVESRLRSGRGIEAGWGIKAGHGIEAGDGIEAGWGIKAGRGIKAGLSISAQFLSCRLRIFAGLINWRLPEQSELEIRAEVRSGTVALGNIVLQEDKAV